jgi:hypothetical protein
LLHELKLNLFLTPQPKLDCRSRPRHLRRDDTTGLQADRGPVRIDHRLRRDDTRYEPDKPPKSLVEHSADSPAKAGSITAAVLQSPRGLAFRSSCRPSPRGAVPSTCRTREARSRIPTPLMLRRAEARLHITGYPQALQQPKLPSLLVRLPQLRTLDHKWPRYPCALRRARRHDIGACQPAEASQPPKPSTQA